MPHYKTKPKNPSIAKGPLSIFLAVNCDRSRSTMFHQAWLVTSRLDYGHPRNLALNHGRQLLVDPLVSYAGGKTIPHPLISPKVCKLLCLPNVSYSNLFHFSIHTFVLWYPILYILLHFVPYIFFTHSLYTFIPPVSTFTLVTFCFVPLRTSSL